MLRAHRKKRKFTLTQLNEIAGQKDADEKEEKLKQKMQSNKKEKKLVVAKVGKLDKYGNPIDDYSDEDDYDEDEEEMYEEERKWSELLYFKNVPPDKIFYKSFRAL